MITRTRHLILALFLVVAAPLALTACGATDAASDLKEVSEVAGEGLAAGEYLKSVNEQQQAYGKVVSSLTYTPPHNAAQAKTFEKAQGDLEKISKELDGIEVDKKFADAHKKLIASVDDTAAAAGDLAAAAKEGDDAAFNKAMETWTEATAAFGKAVEASTKDLQDAANNVS